MIDILLASYNGEKYVSEQIESILNQTYEEWFLYIKDDCSTDNTLDIILKYESKYRDKIKVIKSDKPSGSAKNNFFSMFQYAKSDYIMTCDQDDIWLPDKIEITYIKMMEAEQENSNIPILIHTDLKVVDENLNLISESLFKMQNLDSSKDKINNLLVQNIVTGCTVMVNKKLLSYLNHIPQNAVMHDWWLALIACCLGKIIFIDKSTVLYRQHGRNAVGAVNVKGKDYIFRMLSDIKSIKNSFINVCMQSGELLSVIGDYVDKHNYDKIYYCSLLLKYKKFSRIKLLRKYGLWKNGIVKILGQIVFW